MGTMTHAIVLNGYIQIEYLTDTLTMVHRMDPWPGILVTGWYAWKALDFVVYHIIEDDSINITGIQGDPNVLLDGDGDGVMNFDEQNPRAFECVDNDPDTDNDQVSDKDEIRNYTFHNEPGFHQGHDNAGLKFPDIDMDNKRAENDCDSDDDGQFDGGEDIDGDGHNPEGGETCAFDAGAHEFEFLLTKRVYSAGEQVKISAQSGTFHADTTYNYELGVGCFSMNDGDPLQWDGNFETDADGMANETLVMTCPPATGTYYVCVDVLNDNEYSFPDNEDPRFCFVCQGEPHTRPCGDADCSNNIDIDDVVFLISYIFQSGPAPCPLCMGDANLSGTVDIDDAVYLILYIFSGGPPPIPGCC
jgi:hypothetical protein